MVRSGGGPLVLTASEFLGIEFSDTPYLVEPYVPRQGLVFFHGKKGLGKSPLTWALAQAVASGTPFLGLPTIQGRVLYIEVDTPALHLIQQRIAKMPLPLAQEWVFYLGAPLDVLNSQDVGLATLRTVSKTRGPFDLVIVNTLRKVHRADDKEGHVPSQVYAAFHALFPSAALWFTHHDKKTGDPTVHRPSEEEFSGNLAWVNDATVGLHLVRGGAVEEGILRLEHTHNQVGPTLPPLLIHLDVDGTTIQRYHDKKAETIAEVLRTLDPNLPKRQQARLVAAKLGKGYAERTVWMYLHRAELFVESAKTLQKTTPPLSS